MTRRQVLTFVAATVVLLALLIVFFRRTPDSFPFGDAAVIQIYTLQALRGFLKVGPYSQYGWHHPGPLYFYVLAPFYELAGRRAIGLVAGALAINVGALVVIGLFVRRNSGMPAAAVLLVVLAAFLWRAEGLIGSIWNAHVVILPLAALLVSCAALAAGDRAALPAIVLLASFAVQTDLALLPCSTAIVALAVAVMMRRGRMPSNGARWLGLTAATGLLLWFPTMLQQATGVPGNVTRIWRYLFEAPHSGQSLSSAFSAWADATSAVLRPHLALAWGAAYKPSASSLAPMLALGQLAVLALVMVRAHRAGRTFIAWFCGFSILASLVSGWSIVRIDRIGDYQVFWMSVLGALALAGILMAFVPDDPRAIPSRVVGTLAAAAVVTMAIQALAAERAYAVGQRDGEVRRRLVALDVVDYLQREHVRRPLFYLTERTWSDGVCVILQAYKHQPGLVVAPRWTGVFGDAMSASGGEDAEFHIVDGADHLALSARSDDRVIAGHDGLFVHVFKR